jgi:nucleoside-diphosphate-sugar epimerase
MKNIFLTGGSGFVGKNIIPILIENNYNIYALARSEKSARIITQLGAIVVKDDLLQLSDNTKKALLNCSYVIHAAALMDFTYDPKPFVDLNINATEQLLSYSKEAKIQKFIYVSAAPVIPGSPIINMTEAAAPKGLPSALYPKTKALAERTVLDYNSPTFHTIALRPPAIWGPNNPHFGELMSMIATGKWRWIGGGQQILSTIHVQNLANAILAALTSPANGKAYFVTDGERHSMRSFFTAMMEAQGLQPGNKELPLWIASSAATITQVIWKTFRIKSRPPISPLMIRLMAKEFSISDEKARKELGYANAISIQEGIEQLKK